jgi:hypothetical protein
MRRAAGCLEGGNLVIERLPFAAEHMLTRDDHVDLVGTRGNRSLDLGDARR